MSTDNNKKDDDLKEPSSQERIDLVQGDSVRRWGQLLIALVLIGTGYSYLTFSTVFVVDHEFKL